MSAKREFVVTKPFVPLKIIVIGVLVHQDTNPTLPQKSNAHSYKRERHVTSVNVNCLVLQTNNAHPVKPVKVDSALMVVLITKTVPVNMSVFKVDVTILVQSAIVHD